MVHFIEVVRYIRWFTKTYEIFVKNTTNYKHLYSLVYFEKPGRIRENLTLHCADQPETRISFSGFAVDDSLLDEVFALLEVDELGLDHTDRTMLTTMMDKFGGGPVGLETLAATIGEEAITIEDVYEPYLMQIGFLSRTPRGRCVTKLAYDHLGIPFIAGATTN